MKINNFDSSVNFTIKKLGFLTVEGKLPEVKGNFDLNENSLSDAKIFIEIPVAGINTKNSKRDTHLLQKDFFYAEKYPIITFKSSEITKNENGYTAKGGLNITGNSQTIEIPFKYENNRVTGSFTINRKDFNFGKIPAFVASNVVNISFDCLVQ